ncbi:DUF4142 domain-containing protein [Larkinella knui]|nr:DUF4142 domain-containing protein [Larkinella knui]
MKKKSITLGLLLALFASGLSFAQQTGGTTNTGGTNTGTSTTGSGTTGSTGTSGSTGSTETGTSGSAGTGTTGATGSGTTGSTRMGSGSTGMGPRESGSMMVGKESMEKFDRLNKKGAEAVAAIRPTSAKLSSADQALMLEVAKGGMMQLEVSRAAVQKATSPEVRQLAQAEVEEQTGLSAKLKEIADAKGVTLPTTPDADTQAMVTRMQGMSGTEFDKMYVSESGVKGHEKLDAVMSNVKKNASDSNLKEVEKAAHPLVKTHLKVAQEVMTKMGGSGSTGMR